MRTKKLGVKSVLSTREFIKTMNDKHYFQKKNLLVSKSLYEIASKVSSLDSTSYQVEFNHNNDELLEFTIFGFAQTNYWLEGSAHVLSSGYVDINYHNTIKHLDTPPKIKRGLPIVVLIIWIIWTANMLWNNSTAAEIRVPEECLYTTASGRTIEVQDADCLQATRADSHTVVFFAWGWTIPLILYLLLNKFDFYRKQHQAAHEAGKVLESRFIALMSS
jgi:hypothetical protein